VLLSLSTFVPATVERTFDLSLDIGTHLESMHESGERAVDGVTTGLIALGESVTWRARHFGVTWTMTSTITAWRRPTTFTDEQARGPFASFVHVHRFAPEGDGTRMDDDISYRAPFGVIGVLFDRLVLARHLRRLIEVRNDFIVAQAVRTT
jgi:ligand-binding SRPBCC domain-containing protein